jgi:6-phosphofructokinase 1
VSDNGIDALIAIGGEDTLGVAKRLTDDGIGVVGVPKTIDNDLGATDYTFGFRHRREHRDRGHRPVAARRPESHERTLVAEVMGRHAGWIALHSGHGRRRRRHPGAGVRVRRRPGVPVGRGELRKGPLAGALRG